MAHGTGFGAACDWARGDLASMAERGPLDSEQLATFLMLINTRTWAQVQAAAALEGRTE